MRFRSAHHKSWIGLIQSCQAFSFCEKRNILPLFTSLAPPEASGPPFPVRFQSVFSFCCSTVVRKVKSKKKTVGQSNRHCLGKLKFNSLIYLCFLGLGNIVFLQFRKVHNSQNRSHRHCNEVGYRCGQQNPVKTHQNRHNAN